MAFKPPSTGTIGGIVATIVVTGLATIGMLQVGGDAEINGSLVVRDIASTSTAQGLSVAGRTLLTGNVTTTAGLTPATAGAGAIGNEAYPYGDMSIRRIVVPSSTNSNITVYNTTDQTTNYERATALWSTNVFRLLSQKGGSGTIREMRLGSDGREQIRLNNSSPYTQIISGSSVASTNFDVTFTPNGSSGTAVFQSIGGTVSQSGTAAYTALLVNPTESSTGSGSKFLANFAINSVSKATIDNTGAISATSVALQPGTSSVPALRIFGNNGVNSADGTSLQIIASGASRASITSNAFIFQVGVPPRPVSDNTIDVATTALRFKDGFFAGVLSAGTTSSTNALFSGTVTSTNGVFTTLTRGGSAVCTADGTNCPAGGVNYWAKTGTDVHLATPSDGVTMGAVTTTSLIVTGTVTTTFQNTIAVSGSGTSTIQNGLSVGSISAGNAYLPNTYVDHVYSVGDSRFDSLLTANGITVNSLTATSVQMYGSIQPAPGVTTSAMGTGSNRFADGYFDNFHVSTSTVTGSFVYSGTSPLSVTTGGISVSGNSSIMGTFMAGTSSFTNINTMSTSTVQGMVLNGGLQISDSSQFFVSGSLVCLANGVNCPASGGGTDANWLFNPTGYNGEPSLSMVTSTALLQTGPIQITASTTEDILSLTNTNTHAEVGIKFGSFTGGDSVFSLKVTGPDAGDGAPPNLGLFAFSTTVTQFLFFVDDEEGPVPFIGMNEASGVTDVYGGLRLQPFDFGFIGVGGDYKPILSHNYASTTLDYGSLATVGEEDLTLTVTGATDGDDCERGIPTALGSRAGEIYSCFVSGTNTITVRRTCVAAAGCGDPSPAIVGASYWKH